MAQKSNDILPVYDVNQLSSPNYWTSRFDVISFLIDVTQISLPTIDYPGFNDKLKKTLPSLYYHGCSYGEDGGFFKRLDEGTYIEHCLEHIILEIQSLAGDTVSYGKSVSTFEENIYNVIVSYQNYDKCIDTINISKLFVKKLLDQNVSIEMINDFLTEKIQYLKDTYKEEIIYPSTQIILDEVKKRYMTCISRPDNIYQIGIGADQQYFVGSTTNNTSLLGSDIVQDKIITKKFLDEIRIPTPSYITITNSEHDMNIISEKMKKFNIKFPVCVKPIDGNHGRGVHVNVNTISELFRYIKDAFKESKKHIALIEEMVFGTEYRILVVENEVVSCCQKESANVTGDGVNTIKTLVEIENNKPYRGDGHENILTKIKIDEEYLKKKYGYNLSIIPKKDEKVYLNGTSNLSTGGNATECLQLVNKKNLLNFVKIAKTCNINICGIDIICKDIQLPIDEDNNGAIIEVNASPGLRMHAFKYENNKIIKNEKISEKIVDTFKSTNKCTKIFIHNIDYTDFLWVGKLKDVFNKNENNIVGLCGLKYFEIGDYKKNIFSYHESSKEIILDPLVNIAIFEYNNEIIFEEGLVPQSCDIGFVMSNSKKNKLNDEIYTYKDIYKYLYTKLITFTIDNINNDGWFLMDYDNINMKKYILEDHETKRTINVAVYSNNKIYLDDIKDIMRRKTNVKNCLIFSPKQDSKGKYFDIFDTNNLYDSSVDYTDADDVSHVCLEWMINNL